MFKNILLAYDGSECAQQAAECAGEIALKFSGQVTVVYAFHPVPRGWDPALAEQARTKDVTQGNASVSAVAEQLKAKGIKAQGEVIEGLPAETIVKYARAHKNDLVIIGSQGPAPATSFLLGRVSERVAHAAPCPVLIIR